MFQRNVCAFAAVLCSLTSLVQAQTVPDEYNKMIAHRSAVGTLTDTFAGDRVDLSSGSLEIIQTDVDLPGKNALPVRVGRRFLPNDPWGGGHFGYWTLDIPNVHGTFSGDSGWTAPDFTSNRCSSYGAPPVVESFGGFWKPDEYWHGSFFYLPGSGDQELLQLRGTPHLPSDGNTYHAMTKAGAVVRCVALAGAGAGEGFEVVTQDGVVYTLDHMVARYRGALQKSTPYPAVTAAGTTKTSTVKTQSIGVQPQAPVGYPLKRHDAILFPTKITDRFGNTVTYTWSTTNPWQLLNITASDGRHLDFTYVAADSEKVATVSDGTRTWQYAYGNPNTVTFPDGTVWSSNLQALAQMTVDAEFSCAGVGTTTGVMNARTTYTSAGDIFASGTITGPSGATVTFTMTDVLLGRSHVRYQCVIDGSSQHPTDPYLFLTAAVVGKTITGPGLPANGLKWSYSYGPTNNCWDGITDPSWGVICTSTSPATRSVLVTGPDNVVTRYTFSNQANVDEGLLYAIESGWDGSQAKRKVQIVYGDMDAAPYAGFNGVSPRKTGDHNTTGKPHPQQSITTTQQGRVFTWAVASDCSGVPYCFDSYARPTKVVKSSAPSP